MIFGSAPRIGAALVAIGLVAASCGELTPPEAFSTSTSTSVATGVEQETASQVQERPGLVTGVDGFVPTAAPDYVPTLLVSGSQFVFTVDSALSSPLTGDLADLQTTRAVDDLAGGLVTQEQNGAIVYHQVQADADVLDELGGRLLDVGYWDGSPRAFVEVDDGGAGAVAIDWIQLATERPGAEHERQLHFELEPGESIVAFSASRDLQAVIVQDNQCGQLRVYGADGQIIDLDSPEAPPCVFFGQPSFGAVALSPDGGAIAYTLVQRASDGSEEGTELIVRELVGGSEFPVRRIGESLDVISSLTFDGERAAYLKVSKDTSSVPTVETQSVTLLDLTGTQPEVVVDLLDAGEIASVSFARIPVTAAG